MNTAVIAAVIFFALPFAANSQRLSIGVVGGTNITGNFLKVERTYQASEYNPETHFQLMAGPRSLILGALAEVQLAESFSIEANVLHRPLKATFIYTEFYADGSTKVSIDNHTMVRTWEFPVMLKYSLPPLQFAKRIRPFLAAGPSFRTQESASAAEPSQFGMSAGIGAAFHLGKFRFAPTLRYTRWALESIEPRYSTKPDQVELLASLSYETVSNSRRLAGRKLEIGAIAGLPLTRRFPETHYGGETLVNHSSYLVGLVAQMNVMGNLSVEVNGIYKPLRAHFGPVYSYHHPFSVLTWQFPVLAKYSWSGPSRLTPFVEAGPSFRLAGNLNGYNPSHFGFTVGGGVERRAHGIRLAPALRYTRWAKDPQVYSTDFITNPNAVEAVFGVSF